MVARWHHRILRVLCGCHDGITTWVVLIFVCVVVKQMDKGLQEAKDSSFKAVKLAAQGLESENGPWVVAQGVAPSVFEMWSAKQRVPLEACGT